MNECEFDDNASRIIRFAIEGVRSSVNVWVQDAGIKERIGELLVEVFILAHLGIKKHKCSVIQNG